MNNFFELGNEQRKLVIEQASVRMNNLHPQIIEKDLWVTTFLQMVFSLPFADKLVFKGGTSLSKVWNVIERFSEDIDLAIDRDLFDLHGDLTINQLKKLRKQSSLFVKQSFCQTLKEVAKQCGLQNLCDIEAEPDGEGNRTYPEPRKIFIQYQSLFDPLPYVKTEIVLEIGSRSLIEPTKIEHVESMISEKTSIDTSLINSPIITAVPEKTFIEKIFLLHEIFTAGSNMLADRRSRHLYDLEKMLDMNFAIKAISDNELWSIIHQHRAIFTRINGVDYSQDIRKNISLIPPPQVIDDWRSDYEKMQETMIYGDSLPFDKLIERMEQLCRRIKENRISIL